MIQLFNFTTAITLILMVTGGIIVRTNMLHLDLATVDTFAIFTLIIFAIKWKTIEAKSSVFKLTSKWINDPKAISHAQVFYWVSFALLFLAHVGKHWSLRTDGYDVSFVHQAMFNPFSQKFFPADISPSGSALGEHLLFSLIPISLITQFIRCDELLFLIQALSIAVPLYWIIFKNPIKSFNPGFSWTLVLLVLSTRSLRNGLIFDFREDAIAFLGISIALISITKGKVKTYFLGIILALLSKEHIPFIIPFLALPVMLSKTIPLRKKTKLIVCAGTIFISLLYAIFAFKTLIPYFNPIQKTSSPLLVRFGQFGSTPADIVINIMTSPQNWVKVLSNILNQNVLFYVAAMLLPRFPIFLSKEAFLFAFPGLIGMALNIIPGYPNQTSMIFHYDLAPLAFIFFGLTVGLTEIFHKPIFDKENPRRNSLIFAMILLSLSFSDKWPTFQFTFNFPGTDSIQARAAMIKLDRNLPVIANTRLSAQLNQHKKIIISDGLCDPESIIKYGEFSGYCISDEKERLRQKSPEPKAIPLFKNELIAIYDYSKMKNSDKIAP